MGSDLERQSLFRAIPDACIRRRCAYVVYRGMPGWYWQLLYDLVILVTITEARHDSCLAKTAAAPVVNLAGSPGAADRREVFSMKA